MMNFRIKTKKSLGPGKNWTNTYEVSLDATAVTDAAVATCVDGIVAFEKAIHRTDVQFLAATVSIVEPPGTARDPSHFMTMPLTGNGTVSTAEGPVANILANEFALKVEWGFGAGRAGFCLYRGCINADAYATTEGEPVIEGAAETSFQTLATTALAENGLMNIVKLPKGAGPATAGTAISSASVVGIVARSETRRPKGAFPQTKAGLTAKCEELLKVMGLLAGGATFVNLVYKSVASGAMLTAVEAAGTAVGEILATIAAL
jgi:hypothetical protein